MVFMCVQGRNINNKTVAWENCYQEKTRAHSEDRIAIGTERVLRRLDTWEEVAKSLLSLVPCCRPFPRQLSGLSSNWVSMYINNNNSNNSNKNNNDDDKNTDTPWCPLGGRAGICPCEIYNSYEASSWHELDVQRKILQFVVGYSHPWCILTFGDFCRFQDANAVAVK